MRTIQLGRYSATISVVKVYIGESKGLRLYAPMYLAGAFMIDDWGLDIGAKYFKHRSSAVRYVKTQIQRRCNTARNNALPDYNIIFRDLK